MRTLTLSIPGLLGPQAAVHPDDLPDLPVFNWLVSRATQQTYLNIPASYQLCHLFELSRHEGQDFPIAAISRLSDDNQHPDGIWLRADPVHVSADRDGLILLDKHRFSLSQHDALAIASELKALFSSRGLQLEVPVASRWYVRIPERKDLVTTPIDQVIGKDVLPFMPVGDDRIEWIQLMNEVQMTLHDCEANHRREQDKQLAINSVWFWGYGELPDIINRKWSLVIGEDMLAKGLAMLSATPFQELQSDFSQHSLPDNDFDGLISFHSFNSFNHYQDLEGWIEALIALEQNWLVPIQQQLKSGKLDQLIILTERLRFDIARQSRFHFWKRGKSLISIRSAFENRDAKVNDS